MSQSVQPALQMLTYRMMQEQMVEDVTDVSQQRYPHEAQQVEEGVTDTMEGAEDVGEWHGLADYFWQDQQMMGLLDDRLE